MRLAAKAASDLAAGAPVHTQALVVSLRAFIREALDLDPLPPDLVLPAQGPARPSGGGGKGAGKEGGERGGSGGGGMSAMGMGGGGPGLGLGGDAHRDEA